ncbi:MAG: hypothetical protein ACT4OV_04635 [Microthrixaceae bacterium]
MIDEGSLDEADHLLIHVVEDPGGEHVDLGLRPLDVNIHPFIELAGFTAPTEWAMFGLRAHATAHHLDEPGTSERVTSTYLLHRSGEEASILRRGSSATSLTGPAVGTIPDLCHRILGLPTPPPPCSAALVWSVAWLDRIIDAWGDPAQRRTLSSSWEACARLHPALADAPAGAVAFDGDLGALVARCAAHADAWSWAALRSQPTALALPDGTLPVEITQWMDDGFYARWALGSFPPSDALARDICRLLDEKVTSRVLGVLAAAPRWSSAAQVDGDDMVR